VYDPATVNGLPIALGKGLKKIRRALELNDIFPILGPALSSPPLPDTRTVVEEIERQARSELQREIRAALARNDLLAAVSAIETNGRGMISEAIERNYARPKVSRPDVFAALASLPVAQFASLCQDPWFKLALAERTGPPTRVVCANEPSLAGLAAASGRILVMLHGEAGRPGSCVLARPGYGRLGVGSYGDVLRPLIGGRRILLLGFGPDDPHLRALLDDFGAIADQDPSGHLAPRHFFLGTWTSDADRARLARNGVRAIDVPPGFKLAMVLRRLVGGETHPVPEAPRKKVSLPETPASDVVRGDLEKSLRAAESALRQSEEDRSDLEEKLRSRDEQLQELEARCAELEDRLRAMELALDAAAKRSARGESTEGPARSAWD
jgi:DNA-binding transcriptional MerR regulator